jgi:hypothetical protein
MKPLSAETARERHFRKVVNEANWDSGSNTLSSVVLGGDQKEMRMTGESNYCSYPPVEMPYYAPARILLEAFRTVGLWG